MRDPSPTGEPTVDSLQQQLELEEQRLRTAQSQHSFVRSQMEEVHHELSLLQRHKASGALMFISDEDERELKAEFSRVIYEALDDIKPAAGDEGEEEEGDESAEAEAEVELHAHAAKVQVEYNSIAAAFRVHDAYTFFDLRADFCRHCSIPPSQVDEMELFNPETSETWAESLTVLPEMRKADGGLPVQLRAVPEMTRVAIAADAEKLAEAEMLQEIKQVRRPHFFLFFFGRAVGPIFF